MTFAKIFSSKILKILGNKYKKGSIKFKNPEPSKKIPKKPKKVKKNKQKNL